MVKCGCVCSKGSRSGSCIDSIMGFFFILETLQVIPWYTVNTLLGHMEYISLICNISSYKDRKSLLRCGKKKSFGIKVMENNTCGRFQEEKKGKEIGGLEEKRAGF